MDCLVAAVVILDMSDLKVGIPLLVWLDYHKVSSKDPPDAMPVLRVATTTPGPQILSIINNSP